MDRPDDTEPEASTTRERLAIAALYVVAVAVYAVLGHRMPVPIVSPDEYTYGHLAQSIASGDGLTWRGETVSLRAALYVVAIAPAWLGDSTVTGYTLAKILGAAMACSVVFPVWWLARRVVGPVLGLLTAVLVVSGTALVVAGGILTENLGYPLATWSLVMTVLALRDPGSRFGWAALGFAILAAASRAQLVALVPLILFAVVADAARRERGGRRAALVPHRRLLVATAGLSVAGLVAVLAARGTTLGTYEGIDTTPSLSDIASAAGRQLLGLTTSAGIVPAVIVLAVSARRTAWRDPWVGPLLAVLWAAVAVFVGESAHALAGFDTEWPIERYVMYVLPLGFLVTVAGVARGLARPRAIAIATGAIAVAMLLAPDVREVEEELATYAVADIGDALLGASLQVSLVLATVLAGIACAAAVSWQRLSAPGTRAAALGVAVVAGLAVLAVPAWTWKIDVARGWRAIYPANLQWVDDDAGPPLARLIGATNASVFEVSEFFNSDIGQTFVPETPTGGRVVRGRACTWRASDTGTLEFEAGCGPAPSRFYLDDYYAKFTFYDQRVEQDRPPVARIVSIPPPGRPRLRAEFFPPCTPPLPHVSADGSDPTVGPPRRACEAAAVGGRFWLDRPATLVMRWRGGIDDVEAAVNGQRYTLPEGRLTTIRVPLAAGVGSFMMQMGWRGSPPKAPLLTSAGLVDETGTTELLY